MDHTITSGEQTLMVQTPPNDMNLEVSSQKDCPILSILPLKVRQRIWTMCLGGSTIVLTFSPENIHNMIDNDQRLKSLYRFGAEGLPKKGRSGRRLLAILLTCKQVYESYPFSLIIIRTVSDIWPQKLRSRRHPLLAQPIFSTPHRHCIPYWNVPLLLWQLPPLPRQTPRAATP